MCVCVCVYVCVYVYVHVCVWTCVYGGRLFVCFIWLNVDNKLSCSYCRLSGLCVSRYNTIRAFFDQLVDDDSCVGPSDIKQLLKNIRAPYPVDSADISDCLLSLAEGREEGMYVYIYIYIYIWVSSRVLRVIRLF